MRTDPLQLRDLKKRLTMSGADEVCLPSSFVDGMIADLETASAANEALDDYKRRVALMPSGGEEYVGSEEGQTD